MMIEENSGSASSSDDDSDNNWTPQAISDGQDSTTTSPRSVRGLQMATAEGWLIQRARDMCSFAHDRYRQAAQREAEMLPLEIIAKMSFKVGVLVILARPTHYILSKDCPDDTP
jgi:hypothetical protein